MLSLKGLTRDFYFSSTDQSKYSVDSSIKDRLREKGARAKANILLPLPYWIASLLTGLVAVAYTKLFGLGERLSFYLIHLHGWLIFIITPVCFVAAWWVVKKFAVYARGSGIPQVMAAGEFANPKHDHRVNKLLSIKVMIVKIISSLLIDSRRRCNRQRRSDYTNSRLHF